MFFESIESPLLDRVGPRGLLEWFTAFDHRLDEISGDRAETGDETPEILHGFSTIVLFGERLVHRSGRAFRRGHDGATLSCRTLGIFIDEEQGCERTPHVPLDVVSQHAEEDMRPYAVFQPMIDWADLEIDGLHRAKRALHTREVLVRLHDGSRLHLIRRHTGSNHVDAV